MEKNKEPKPRISVIVPIYNSREWLRQCLDSLLAQTFSDFEIVAVNDGSTDGSRGILETYERTDRRIRIVDRPNGGQSAARNTGIEASRGRYLFFIDSDDTVSPLALEILYSALHKQQATIAIGRITFDNKKLANNKSGLTDYDSFSGEAFTEMLLYQTGKYKLTPCGIIFDRNLFDVRNRFIEGQYYEDLELIPRITSGCPEIALVDAPLYYYRQHPSSFIHTFRPSRFDSLKSVASLQKNVAPLSLSLKKAVDDRTLSANFNAYLLATGREGYEETADSCWKTIRRLRLASLINPKVRLKNKAGILLSYLGRRFFDWLMG